MAHALEDESKDKKIERKKSVDVDVTPPPPPPPDGGWGWFVVFASFMIHVVTDGITYSWGTVRTELVKEFKHSESATAWVNSILIGITLCSGPLCSIFVNKYGCRTATIAGAILGCFFLLISSFAPNLFMLYGTVGIGTGFGFGLIYLPAIVCVSVYFEKKRSLATGIAVCGSGAGTALIDLLCKYAVEHYQWRNTLRLLSLLVLCCILFGLLFREIKVVQDPTELPMLEVTVMNDNNSKVPHKNGLSKNGFDRPQSLSNVNHKKYYFPDSKNDTTNIAMSQPALAKNMLHPEHGHVFGSGVMDRDDIFLQGSVENLRARSASLGNKDINKSYKMSLRSLPSVKSSQDFEKNECTTTNNEKVSILQRMLDISLLKDPIFILFVISNFCTSIGFNAPYVFLPDLAMKNYSLTVTSYNNITNMTETIQTYKVMGLKKDDTDWILSCIAIGNTIGRIVLGYLADRSWVNRLHVYNFCLTVCGIGIIMGVWCTTFVHFILCALVFGFTAGAYVGLTSVVLVDLMGLDRLTNAFGLLLFFQGLASFLGLPLAGFLYDTYGTYDSSFFAAGGMIAASGIMLIIIPYLQRRQISQNTKIIVSNAL